MVGGGGGGGGSIQYKTLMLFVVKAFMYATSHSKLSDAYTRWNAFSSFGSYISVVGIYISKNNKRYVPSPWTIEQNLTSSEWLVQSPPAFYTFGEISVTKETKSYVQAIQQLSNISYLFSIPFSIGLIVDLPFITLFPSTDEDHQPMMPLIYLTLHLDGLLEYSSLFQNHHPVSKAYLLSEISNIGQECLVNVVTYPTTLLVSFTLLISDPQLLAF
ncbi:hypothetical protein KPL70_017542 [Citrus sinensis]|nr:hypothetical protein KPL70_017542 [Citrus sinensis]